MLTITPGVQLSDVSLSRVFAGHRRHRNDHDDCFVEDVDDLRDAISAASGLRGVVRVW